MAWLIAGLGNPGAEYAKTRHNAGFMVLDAFAKAVGASFKRDSKHNALVATGVYNGEKLILVQPQTFMNLSGNAVQSVAKYYNIEPENIIVVHDDIDLPFAAIKLKIGGSDGGHNGLKSITKSLSTGNYFRVRIGVGRSNGEHSGVLQNFKGNDAKELPFVISDGQTAVEMLIDKGLVAAQLRYHTKD